jgi:hypothetical protein
VALRSTSLLAGAFATSVAIPVPAGAAVGDIAVVGVYLENADTITPPSGFTFKDEGAASPTTRGRLAVYWKRLTAADSGNYTFSWTNNTFASGVAALFSGRVATGDPFDVAPTVGQTSVTSTVCPISNSPVSDGCDAVWMSSNFAGGATWTPPTNYTEQRDNDTSYLATRDNISSGSTGSITATTNTSGFLKSFLGALTPAPPTTVQHIATTTGAPAAATAFTPTLPTHIAGDRLVLIVTGKYNTTTIPTINQGWTVVQSGTGGTGATGNDAGQTFWAVYAKDAASSAETAPTVTPGGTAPNSWEWVCTSHRAVTSWRDAITNGAGWVTAASDSNTASPLSGTAGAFTGQPTEGDAIFSVGVIPTDLGSALASVTLTATGLSGGSIDQASAQYVENSLGQDTAAVWASWVNFFGTASAGLAMSFTITGASNHSGSLVAIALRQNPALTPVSNGLSLLWNVAAVSLTPVQKSLSLSWNVVGSAQKGLALQWNVVGGVQKSLNLLYNIRAGVQDPLVLSWNIRAGVQDPLVLLWDLKAGVNKPLALQWNVVGSAQKSLSLLYNIRTDLSKPLALQWNMRSGVQNPLALLYNIRSGVQNSLALQWNLLGGVQKSLNTTWNIRAGTQKSLELQWNVLASLGAVQKGLSLLWNMGGPVSKPLSLQWNVRAGTQKSLALQWNLRAGVQDPLVLLWDVRAGVNKSLALQYNILSGTQKSLALQWHLRSGVAKSLALQWNVLSDATPFKLGADNVTSMRVGSVAASRLYLGADQIWP